MKKKLLRALAVLVASAVRKILPRFAAIMGMLIVEADAARAALTDGPPEADTVPALVPGDDPDPQEDDSGSPEVNLGGVAGIDLDTWGHLTVGDRSREGPPGGSGEVGEV